MSMMDILKKKRAEALIVKDIQGIAYPPPLPTAPQRSLQRLLEVREERGTPLTPGLTKIIQARVAAPPPPPAPPKGDGLDITDVIAPFFPPLMLWKMGEWLPPEIAGAVSPISALSTLKQVTGTPEEQKAVLERSVLPKILPEIGLPDVFGGVKELPKYLLYGGLALAGIYIAGKVLGRKT